MARGIGAGAYRVCGLGRRGHATPSPSHDRPDPAAEDSGYGGKLGMADAEGDDPCLFIGRVSGLDPSDNRLSVPEGPEGLRGPEPETGKLFTNESLERHPNRGSPQGGGYAVIRPNIFRHATSLVRSYLTESAY